MDGDIDLIRILHANLKFSDIKESKNITKTKLREKSQPYKAIHILEIIQISKKMPKAIYDTRN